MNELARQIHQYAKSKGWWDTKRNMGELLANVHSEVSEAWEDYRDGNMTTYFVGMKPCGFPSEMADIIIRVLDICAAFGIDIEAEIAAKMAYNKTRPYRHGGKKA